MKVKRVKYKVCNHCGTLLSQSRRSDVDFGDFCCDVWIEYCPECRDVKSIWND